MKQGIYLLKWAWLLSVTVVIGFLLGATAMRYYLNSTQPTQQIISPQPRVLGISLENQTNDPGPSKALEEAVTTALKGTKGTYAVVIKNLNTGEYYYQNENCVFDTASLYKLWVMATVYASIEKGSLKETQTLHEAIPTLNQKFNIASESAEKTEGEITLTVSQALQKMITVSDNYAALLLTAKVRLSNVAAFLDGNGFSESKVGKGGNNPTTTARDIAGFLEKVYKKELVSTQASEAMLSLLKEQQLNGKIPRLLPKSLTIAHKTGELTPFSHDAGIIYTPKGNYILVVLSESNDKEGADSRIATVSQHVYQYFQSE